MSEKKKLVVSDPFAMAEDESLPRTVAHVVVPAYAANQFAGGDTGWLTLLFLKWEVFPDADLLWHYGRVYAFLLCADFTLLRISP